MSVSGGEPTTIGAREPGLAGVLISADVGLLVLIGLFFGAFWLFAPGFNSPFNLFGLSRFTAINIVIGLSMMAVIVTGGLDLSIGAVGVSAVMLAGWLMEVGGVPVAFAVSGGVALGACLGALNGLVIVRTGVHSFIVTLATMSIYFGAMIVVTHAESFRNLPAEFSTLAKLRWFGFLSPTLLVAGGAALGLFVLYRFTALGRRMLAAGANPRAAKMSGVPVRRVITLCHMLGGALAALAGMLLAMRTGAAIPSMAGNLGQDWLLPAFLGPVLGGTALTGGRVSVFGTVLGATLVTVLTSGLLLLQVGEFWVQFFLGALLLGAVLLERLRIMLLGARRIVA